MAKYTAQDRILKHQLAIEEELKKEATRNTKTLNVLQEKVQAIETKEKELAAKKAGYLAEIAALRNDEDAETSDDTSAEASA